MKQQANAGIGFFSGLTDDEMKQTTGGGVMDKILGALLGMGISAFYEMGKQEGRMARKRMHLN